MNTAGNAHEDKLRQDIARDEKFARGGEYAVIVGLFTEVVIAIRFNQGNSVVERWGPVFGEGLVVIGVATEILFANLARLKANGLQRLSDEKVASANERAAQAQAMAEQANARGVMLMKEANEARLEQERLKAVLAWRTIPKTARTNIASRLAQHVGTVTIAYIQNDPESIFFAVSIKEIFEEANNIAKQPIWHVSIEPRMYSDKAVFGLYISGQGNSVSTQAIQQAFSSQNIPFSPQHMPNQGINVGPSLALGPIPLRTEALIVVGSKTPPV